MESIAYVVVGAILVVTGFRGVKHAGPSTRVLVRLGGALLVIIGIGFVLSGVYSAGRLTGNGVSSVARPSIPPASTPSR